MIIRIRHAWGQALVARGTDLLPVCCALAWLTVVGCERLPHIEYPAEVTILSLDTLVTTESGLIANATDVEIDASGDIYVADSQASRILVFTPHGEVDTLGGPGQGPGEFAGISAIRLTEDGIFVADTRNGRLQHLTRAGAFQGVAPLAPFVLRAQPHILDDGSLVVSTWGRDSALVAGFDSEGGRTRSVGTLVVPETLSGLQGIQERIAQGEIPDQLRNDVAVTGDGEGRVWVALQTEGVVRQYGADGTLEWSVTLGDPAMIRAKSRFFQMNEEAEGAAFFPLRQFRHLARVDGELWLLLDTEPGAEAIILVLGEGGGLMRRIAIPHAGGAMTFAAGGPRRQLVLYTPHDAQVLVGPIP